MMNEHYLECRTLPAINETFPQFSTIPTPLHTLPTLPPAALSSQYPIHVQPLLKQHSQEIATVNNRILSPLDLSLRAGVNIVPITPPSTPSPPRKRARFMTDETYLWRPHVMGTPHNVENTKASHNINMTTTTIAKEEHKYVVTSMTHTGGEDLSLYNVHEDEDDRGYVAGLAQNTFMDNRLVREPEGVCNNFREITRSQRSVALMDEYQRQPQKQQQQQQHQDQHQHSLTAICVDDETIVLTEDEEEDEEEVEDVDSHEFNNNDNVNGTSSELEVLDSEVDEENETLVSSQELNEDIESNETQQHSRQNHTAIQQNSLPDNEEATKSPACNSLAETNEEEEYVDILSNDDDDINPLSSKALVMLRLQSQTNLEQELSKSGHVLTRNKLVYENEELHHRAVNGLAKLFDRDFQENSSNENVNKEKTYIDLTNCSKSTSSPYKIYGDVGKQATMIASSSHHIANSATSVKSSFKTHKTERKRMKLRKHMSVDEETISPVSGTIIRKLRDDEELVVRKGDIDPAFNVVEVTEEAKAILASIDNKIGAYLCQLCRTLYDDAFKLAQHRCPRIVHIEYKCSECEKVFNCPANLASHRRWHKPKSELLANSQAKKRQNTERIFPSASQSPDKTSQDDGLDGIYPCNQCGKTFRRHAYLKKHQASHQMLENLKSLDIFKNSANNISGVNTPSNGRNVPINSSALHIPTRMQSNSLYPPVVQPRAPYSNTTRFGSFPFGSPFDHRRFYTLGEFYLSQQLERSSAFQYVQANHLRSFVNRPIAPTPIVPLPVK